MNCFLPLENEPWSPFQNGCKEGTEIWKIGMHSKLLTWHRSFNSLSLLFTPQINLQYYSFLLMLTAHVWSKIRVVGFICFYNSNLFQKDAKECGTHITLTEAHFPSFQKVSLSYPLRSTRTPSILLGIPVQLEMERNFIMLKHLSTLHSCPSCRFSLRNKSAN